MLFFLCIQGIHHNLAVGVDDDGAVGVVDDHAGFAAGELFHLADGGGVHGDVLTAAVFRVEGCQLGGLGQGVVRGRGAAAGDDDVAAGNLAGVAPDVVLSGQAEGQFLILPVVPAYIDGIAVGGFKPHGLELSLLHPLPAGVRPEIAALLKLQPNFLQLGLGLGPVQFFQNALQIAKLRMPQLELMGQLLFRILHPGVVLVEFGGVLLGGENGGDGNLDDLHIRVVKILAGDGGLSLDDLMNVGGDNVPQLPQPLPVIGGFQLFFLEGQLPGQTGAEILDGFAHRLAFLPHGILPIPDGVVAVQQGAKGGSLLTAAAVLPDGAEGVLLGGAVRQTVEPGSGVGEVFPEEKG